MAATKRDLVKILGEHLKKQQLSQYRIALLLAGMVKESLEMVRPLLDSGRLVEAKKELESTRKSVLDVARMLQQRLRQASRPGS